MKKFRRRVIDCRILFVGIAFVVSALGFKASPVSSSVIQVRAEVNKELAHVLSVVQVKANPDLAMESVPGWTVLQVFTRDRKHSAYLLCVPLKSKEDPNAARTAYILTTTPDPQRFMRFAVNRI